MPTQCCTYRCISRPYSWPRNLVFNSLPIHRRWFLPRRNHWSHNMRPLRLGLDFMGCIAKVKTLRKLYSTAPATVPPSLLASPRKPRLSSSMSTCPNCKYAFTPCYYIVLDYCKCPECKHIFSDGSKLPHPPFKRTKYSSF